MPGIRQRIASVRLRQQGQWTGQCVAYGLLAGGLLASAFAGAILLGAVDRAASAAVVVTLAGGPVLGLILSLVLPRPLRGAAVEIDRQCGLKDRAATAWAFLNRKDLSPLQELQLADAEKHLAGIDPGRVVPFRMPRLFPAGVAASVLALGLTMFVPAPEAAMAAPAVNDVVVAQAERAESELAKLEEFNRESPDPEIEQLLKELATKIEELKQPGVDPREALAKLSEMQSALEARQKDLSDSQLAAAQLQSVGEALSLAEPLKAAGQALSGGEMEKAAHELEKAELPQLDRQTERALTEKLDKIHEDSAGGAGRKLQEAVGQTSEGLTQGNKNKFSEGMEGLASEARRQGRRNRLSDLLRKQSQCLGECKGECEGECKKEGESNNKGGKSWGLGRSSNEPGEKTGLLKSPRNMQLKGQESAAGDVDVETIESPEEKQQATRAYREKIDKYKQLSESVLDSEPIPLGHRQTIRRYFEMIRPQAAEVDTVIDRTQTGEK